MASAFVSRCTSVGLTCLTLAAGCMLVAPLDELPERLPSAAGQAGSPANGHGNQAGTSQIGESGAASGGNGSNATCQVNSDCAIPGSDEPYRCRTSDRTCVPLRSHECPLVYGDTQDPHAIYFGSFAALKPVRPELDPVVWAYRLALDELSGDELGGLPGGPGGATRPLVMIVCNNDASAVDGAMLHLSERVEVPAVIANLKLGDLRRAFENYRHGQLFFLSPGGATSALAALDDFGLLWHMLGQPADFAPIYASTLELAEKYVQKTRALERDVRVALVTTTEAFDSGLANSAIELLKFNGKNVRSNELAGTYRGFTIELTERKLPELASAITEFLPDIVISAASDAFVEHEGLLEQLEAIWGETGADRPFYILSPFNAGALSGVLELINAQMAGHGIDREAYRRFIGLSAARSDDPTLYNQFATRLRTRFPDAHSETENYYDAIYFLAYSMHAAGSVAELTGPAIARGMLRLLDGKQQYGVGPNEIAAVESALSVPNATIRLNGTLGPPDFNQQTGVRVENGSMFCFARPEGETARLKNHALRYDRKTGEFVGEFGCFSGFFP